ncbi:hypothetical protein Phum_PHUM506940 [Pediculus humanus corporis]|uniref:Uncharacterized protein n=1 Tax=Pediculus humanus subsp. corporis TaxID=121224 RepID=E0VXZ4_PEDHC|nr:uncharacterized protein Phum_PHUM506940 [Pediculus humanus corporis]EEB18250.1 hypothetical protein Phum_PHUM506940 [Pediculus humanus corporis]
MSDKSLLTTSFFLLIFASFVKASSLGIKLLIMMGAGLAGMYMMHLLAQDYNKYTSLNRPSRSVDNLHDNTTTFIMDEEVVRESENNYRLNEIITFEKIIQFDPTGCARRYVCTIATKSNKKQNQYERNLIQILRSNNGKHDTGREAFNFALNLGRDKKDPDACAREYSKCLFSVSEMLKLVGIS